VDSLTPVQIDLLIDNDVHIAENRKHHSVREEKEGEEDGSSVASEDSVPW